MRITGNTLEGTWEEISDQAPMLSGKQVRLTILSSDDGGIPESEARQRRLAAVLESVAGSIHSGDAENCSDHPYGNKLFGDYVERKHRESHG